MKLKSLIFLISRLILAAVFIFSGVVKSIDPLGTAYKIGDYLEAFGFTADVSAFALCASIALSGLEFVLGWNLLFNLKTKISLLATAVFMAIMTPLTLFIALKNPVSDCGCFGDALKLTNWQTFFKNLVLVAVLAVSFFSFEKNKSRFNSWIFVILATVISVVFSIYNYRHLPIVDFRPYKIGTHLLSAMEIPENAEQDEFLTTFIYEKNGEKQSFTLENYPASDTAWHFVEQRTELVREGFRPPVHDFALISADGEDLTQTLLSRDGYLFLLIAYDLDKADLRFAERVNEIYDFAFFAGHEFYAVTASGFNSIMNFSQKTAARYPFLSADPTTLKTVIRSNPGLLLLHDGVIIAKFHARDIPTAEKFLETYFKE